MSDTILQSNDVMDSRRGDIVVGVDGSDESFAALRWALGEASLTGQQVNAVYAWTHSWDMGSQPEDEERKDCKHDLFAQLRDLPGIFDGLDHVRPPRTFHLPQRSSP